MRLLRDLVDELLQAQVKSKLFGRPVEPPTLGRLVIEKRLGAGAMGTVFEAFDPKLERKVAVKVLRGDATRVLPEARALAKLSHPNVVAVHDADEVDGLVYIVMEHIDGASLRAWGAHPWRDVVRVMREAASGIAAAHAAGLVHRDIKPDNILIGTDRTRVVDFGLAYAGDGSGTPLYMAPEVLAGEPATPASDQFSFGVTLYEALYGKRPHGAMPSEQAATQPADAKAPRQPNDIVAASTHHTGATSRSKMIEELRVAARRASDAPRVGDVPAWLHAIVTRMLQAEPAARFPSMNDVVHALHRDRRRKTGMIAIAVATLALGGVVGTRLAHKERDCTGEYQMDAAWSADVRARIEKKLGSVAIVDDKARAWKTAYSGVCRAAKPTDPRMRCLMRTYDRFRALVDALAATDARTIDGGSATDTRAAAERYAALAAFAALDIAACERATGAADPREASPLDRAEALIALGRYKDARTALPSTTMSTQRLEAERLALAASIEARVGDGAKARELLDQASLAAANANAPELELDIWSRRLRNELFAGDPAKVLEWATFARAAAKRAGLDGAELNGIVGEALRAQGKLGPARDALMAALASSDPLRPEQRAVIEMNLGSVQLATGDSTAALKTLTQARDRVLSAFGDKHPDLALYTDKLAAAERARGSLRKALALHDQSLALRIGAFGPDDRSVATSLFYRAQTKLEAGDLEGASADAARAKAIRTKVYGEASPRLGEILELIADIADERGLPELAVQPREQAYKLDSRLVVSTAPLADDDLLSIERARVLAQHPDAATAQALRKRVTDASDPALVVAVGEALLAVGDKAAATELLAPAAKRLGNEPTRTALHLMVALAKASQDPQAARTAISLYQAMPKLARPDIDAMWALAKAN